MEKSRLLTLGGKAMGWNGLELYTNTNRARKVLDRCEQIFLNERGTSLLDVMFGREGDGQLGNTEWEQPALYALECALTALWASVGVFPDVVLGHSVGEIAAAQAANVFSLEEGMKSRATVVNCLAQPNQLANGSCPSLHPNMLNPTQITKR